MRLVSSTLDASPPGPRAAHGRDPVTVVVRRHVRAGHEPVYERWLTRLVEEAGTLPGFLGAEVIRPAAGGPSEYTSVFRFDSIAHLRDFETSELRRRYLAEIAGHVAPDPVYERLTGLELWFSPPRGTVVPQPIRWRMAIVMTVVVYGLVLSIGSLVAIVAAPVPAPLRLLLTIAIEIALMTYVLMPRLTRWLARWIYPRRAVAG